MPAPAPPLFPLSNAWTAALEHPIEGPLAVAGPRVLVHTRDGTVHALAAADGRPAWRTAAAPGVLGAGEAIACLRLPDGTVQALAPETGRERWRSPTVITGDLPPVVEGDRVLLAGQGMAALEAGSGRILWSVAGSTQATSPPVQVGPCVLIGEGETLHCREAGTGRSRWEYRARGVITAAPVSDAGGRLFLGSAGREFLALDLEDGDRDWRWKVGADVRWPAVVWGRLVIFATHENVLYALKRRGGNMAWRASLPSRPLAPPLLVGDNVLVACYGRRPDENFLVGFDTLTGERLGDLRTPGELAAAPLAAAGRLFLPLRDRKVVALVLPLPPSPARSLTSPGSLARLGFRTTDNPFLEELTRCPSERQSPCSRWRRSPRPAAAAHPVSRPHRRPPPPPLRPRARPAPAPSPGRSASRARRPRRRR